MAGKKDAEAIKAAKRESNRKSHAASKARQEHVLLRLEPGSLAALDAARLAAGLSRPAFASIHLIPLAAALAERLPAIDRELRTRRISLSTFLSRAIDAEIAKGQARQAAPSAADSLADALQALRA